MARVYHQPFKVRLIYKNFKEFFPHSSIPPTAESPVSILPVTIIGRKISPRCACPQNPENSVDELPIISGITSPGAFATGKMIFQKFPRFVADVMSVIHILHWYILLEKNTSYQNDLKDSFIH